MDEKKIVSRYTLRLFDPKGQEVAKRNLNIWKNEPDPADVAKYSAEMRARELAMEALHHEGLV